MTTPKLLYTIEQPHGLGELYFLWQKGESHSLLATTGTDATVAIHDRTGQLMERMKLQGLCGAMEWDQDGDYLAMITPNSNLVLLWECHGNKRVNIETGLREPPSCLAWAYGEPLLAVGTQKGNLAFILVLASEDKSLSINNSDGDTLRVITLRDVPYDLQTLYLYNLLNPENPIELAFQQRYGSIVSYKWYGDGYILIGFSAGFVIAISTHIKEVGEELFQVKNHKESLTDIKANLCLEQRRGIRISVADRRLRAMRVELRRSTPGNVRTRLPERVRDSPTAAVCCIRHQGHRPDEPYRSHAEPSLIALGGGHVCCVRGAEAWFYPLAGGSALRRQYPGPVDVLRVAANRAAALCQVTSLFTLLIHTCALTALHADIGGARACVLDVRRRALVYAPAAAERAALPPLHANMRGVVWDICLSERNVFIVYTDDTIETYYYSANSINGAHVQWVASTSILPGQVPLILFCGDAYCYTSGGNDVAMVWALEDASQIEDLSILCGMLCACLGKGEAAARWLESSPRGALQALELHVARGDWAKAAEIAEHACPQRAKDITLHQAQHLELTADYHEALANYEKSIITENVDDIKVKEHNAKCEAGIARSAVRCGDVMRAVTTAMKHAHDTMLLKECAQLLEEEKHYSHAAALYDHAGNTEKAASLYIKLKSWLKVEALLPKINSPSIHIQYAKAKEAEGRYHDALKSYMKAQDYESAIRLNLDKLEDIDEAVNLVQETKSVQGAKMVANYFQNSDDPTSAIKFLVMSLCYEEAFQLARKNGKLHLYGEILIQTSQARPEDFKSLALHFEGEKNHLLAGKFYFHAGEYGKAMSHLIKSGGSEDEENEAIKFLLGDTDGNPREPRHLFRLYMAKRQFAEAAKTAVIIANAECRSGRYREARDVVRGMCAALRARRLARGRHDLAARLLLRTADDIEFFPTPAHQVSILTSAVIECGRAGLKHQAHHWAKVLMQPEYRSQVSVIECGRAGLKHQAHHWAKVLMQPEYRSQVSVIECGRAGLKHQAHHWAKVLMQPEYRSQVSVIECGRAGLKHQAHHWAKVLMQPEYRSQ
ncbi:putative WD repeat domain 19, partial [Operophtera brumata]